MSDKLFVKQSFQPPGMGWALVVSIGFIVISVVASCWANGPVTGLYFALTEYGWKTDPNNSSEVIHPIAQKIALTFRYLTVIPPLISLFWGIGQRGVGKYLSSKLLEDHTVVCGLGWQGRSFIKSLHARGEPVVSIELAADEPAEKFCKDKKCTLIYGNAEVEKVLRSAGVAQAKEVFICTGSQDENLSVAQAIGKLMQQVPKRDEPLQVHVSLGELPIDDADTDQLFFPLLQASVANTDEQPSDRRDTKPLQAEDNCHFLVYDPDRRMARCFFYRHKVYQWADEMASTRRWLNAKQGIDVQNQSYRVHLVFLGYTRLVGELILQYARIWPSANQYSPYFTIICENDREAAAFLARHACLSERGSEEQLLKPGTVFCHETGVTDDPLNGSLGVLGRDKLPKPGTVFIHQRGGNAEFLDKPLMESIDTLSPVTAVICSAENTEQSLQRASHCRILAKRLDLWQVPVFSDLEDRQGTEGLLEVAEAQPFASERTIPFGSSLHYCDTELLTYSDKLAKAIHDSYYQGQQNNEGPSIDSSGKLLPAVKRWSILEQRYQRSNYRAADAAVLKLYSAGYRWNTVAPTAHIDAFSDEQEVLSRSEHQSWINEKLLDHWRYGARDEQRKKHPSIVPWKELNEVDRKKDSDQIDTLRAQFESDTPTAGKPLTIGFIGHTNITEPQARSCRHQLRKKLENFEKLNKSGTCFWVELMSPLAPGSDMVLIEEAVKVLTTHTGSIAGFRLRIPYAVPWDKVDDDFRSHWEQGNQWLYHQQDYQHNGSNTDWALFKEAMQKERSQLFTTMRKAGYPVEVVDLTYNGDKPLSNRDGYRRAARWIVEKSEVLVAVLDESRMRSPTDVWTDGGTGHSVAQWEHLKKGEYLRIDPLIEPH